MLSRIFHMLAIGILGMTMHHSASGARFPDGVERKIVIIGKSAVTLAELFGFAPDKSSSISLQLGRNDAWAVYLLKQDTKERLWNDNKGSPLCYNSMTFSPAPAPSVTISPYWLDLGTRRPDPQKGYYSFNSPFLSEELNEDNPWVKLVRKLKTEREWKESQKLPFRRQFESTDGTLLSIEVWNATDYTGNKQRKGYQVTIIARLK